MEVESFPWDYQSIMSLDGSAINVSFCPVPTPEVHEEILSASVSNTGNPTQSSPIREQGWRSNS